MAMEDTHLRGKPNCWKSQAVCAIQNAIKVTLRADDLVATQDSKKWEKIVSGCRVLSRSD
jgi:hypothetical protein